MTATAGRITLAPGTGTVEVNGEPLRGVRAVTITGSVNTRPVVEVGLLVRTVEVDGELRAHIAPQVAESLRWLGWTPPPTGHDDDQEVTRAAPRD